MYLYIPMGGRSLQIDEYTVSSTGIQFDKPIDKLEAVLGILLTREGMEILVPAAPEPVASVMEIPTMPQTE